MTTTYTKLRDGSWGVRVQGPAKEGQVVTVSKKKGGHDLRTIRRVLWTGDGISLCSVFSGEDETEPRTTSKPKASKPRRECCAECGRPGALVEDLEDGLMKHYGCCDIPSER